MYRVWGVFEYGTHWGGTLASPKSVYSFAEAMGKVQGCVGVKVEGPECTFIIRRKNK